ncbi:hypothetical protein BSL78_20167 [Apostichopus japonicus]|uniref:Uncharacterized protein n=1 Tax=Stichopus japonicus TaxID=307972 RepID=A0A2G8K4N7_STIJA|nr:hypothetical protein BSL78_20167 [Apostichopus japonicus]
MRLYLFFVFITYLGKATPSDILDDDTFGVEMSFILPITEADLANKPTHGICFEDTSAECSVPGERVTYAGALQCLACFCSDDLKVFCCRRDPYPKLKDPSRCELTLNEKKCKYVRHPRCKDYCSVTGWYFSDVAQILSVPIQEE